VGLVDDRVSEARVVGWPTQEKVVVGDDELRARQCRTSLAERTALLVGALLARAVLGPGGHRPTQQVAQRGKAAQERPRDGSDLTVRSRPRAGQEGCARQSLPSEETRLSALRERGVESARTHVVGSTLDRERLEIGVSEHARRRRDVLAEQLILKELRARRNRNQTTLAGLRAIHREGDRCGEVGEGLPDARTSLEQQDASFGEIAHEAAREPDLLRTHAVVREVASTEVLVRQGSSNGVLVERDRGLGSLADLHVVTLQAGGSDRGGEWRIAGCLGGVRELLLAEQGQPGGLRGERLEGSAHRAVARLLRSRAGADA
jgi:hypothetical protein